LIFLFHHIAVFGGTSGGTRILFHHITNWWNSGGTAKSLAGQWF
jgi:hypothetical protein